MNKLFTGLTLILMAGIAGGVFSGTLWADDAPNRGAAEIVMEGGKPGKVPFPHHRHQEDQADCLSCHQLFPQKSGSVEQLKADGVLKPKQVMNKLCVKCHKQQKKAQQPSGPVTCKTCHIKEMN